MASGKGFLISNGLWAGVIRNGLWAENEPLCNDNNTQASLLQSNILIDNAQSSLQSVVGSPALTPVNPIVNVVGIERLYGGFMMCSPRKPINMSTNVNVHPTPFEDNYVTTRGTLLSATTNVASNPNSYALNVEIPPVTPLSVITDVNMRDISSPFTQCSFNISNMSTSTSSSRQPLADVSNVERALDPHCNRALLSTVRNSSKVSSRTDVRNLNSDYEQVTYHNNAYGGRVDRSINTGNAPPVFRISGQNYHCIGSLVLGEGSTPKFAQLYIYDTDNEVNNRINSVRRDNNSGDIREDIVEKLKNMLDQNNVLVKCFRMARTEIQSNPIVEVKMNLIGRRSQDGRTYNLPTANEVAALIVRDLDPSMGDLDILIQSRTGQLKRINQLNPAYLPLQYPLLFPYGEDGYREDISFSDAWHQRHHGGRKRISPKEYFSFYIHERVNENHTLLYSRRLFQQYLVDAYTMIESARLIYIRTHQKALRCEAYQGLSDALTRGELDPTSRGKRIILPSSFTGGARYMIQKYQDAMAICRQIGYPHLFITFTCNPKWPEIERYVVHRGLKPEDRPDIICRVFKMKLDAMIEDIKTQKLFGDICGVIYTIEFQKRGLPHAHILLFAKTINRVNSAAEIDAIISAEIPDPDADTEYHDVVGEFMLHGPCGQLRKNSPCMINGKCSKFFPKKYVSHTCLDKDGYPIYRRRDNGSIIARNGIELDNRYVVAHNKYLLLKYRAHINVEWCNQSRSIKYLFKYVNKGNDRVTAEFMSSSTNGRNDDVVDEINMYYDCRYISADEINMYYDCRYISACEATWRLFGYAIHYRTPPWRLFGYAIHYRTPPVERLNFHLEHQQNVVYGEDQTLDEIVDNQTVKQSQFTAWFEANKKYEDARSLTYAEFPSNEDARSLTYAEFPSKFVWKQDTYAEFPSKFVWKQDLYAEFPSKFVWKQDLREWKPRKRGFSIGRLFYVPPGCGELYYLRCLLNLISGPSNHDDIRTIAGVIHKSYRDACYEYGLLDDDKEYIDGITDSSYWASASALRRLFATLLSSSTISRPEVVWDAVWEFLAEDAQFHHRRRMNNPDSDKKQFALVELEKLLTLWGKSLRDFPDMPLPDETNIGFMENMLIAEELAYDKESLKIEHKTLLTQLTDEQKNVYDSVINDIDCNGGGLFFVYGYGGTGKTFVWRTLSSMIRSRGDIVLNVASSGIASLLLPGGRTSHSRFAIPLSLNEDSTCNISQVIPKATRPVVVGATINSSYLWTNCKVLRLTKNLRLRSLASEEDRQTVDWFSKWIANIGDGITGVVNNGLSEIDIPPRFLLNCGHDPIATIVGKHIPKREIWHD
ncbi:uncharacterized protein LOC116015818 [Ipomoea triloba]|uniref:uncharacterized protein LOC116015818 n=1 Tax=Ipomoea triloba TaxID=35885 RepID=UPI00125DE931|nr:uncharacterized protein LOC116015818 [Ipomoea triloba]